MLLGYHAPAPVATLRNMTVDESKELLHRHNLAKSSHRRVAHDQEGGREHSRGESPGPRVPLSVNTPLVLIMSSVVRTSLENNPWIGSHSLHHMLLYE